MTVFGFGFDFAILKNSLTCTLVPRTFKAHLAILQAGKEVFNNDKTITSKARRPAARPDFCRLVRGVSRAGGGELGRRGGSSAYHLRSLGRGGDARASLLHGGIDPPAEGKRLTMGSQLAPLSPPCATALAARQ